MTGGHPPEHLIGLVGGEPYVEGDVIFRHISTTISLDIVTPRIMICVRPGDSGDLALRVPDERVSVGSLHPLLPDGLCAEISDAEDVEGGR